MSEAQLGKLVLVRVFVMLCLARSGAIAMRCSHLKDDLLNHLRRLVIAHSCPLVSILETCTGPRGESILISKVWFALF